MPEPAERKTVCARSPAYSSEVAGAEHLLLFLLLFLLLLLLLGLAGSLDNRGRDAVEVTLAILGNAAAAVVGLLQDANLLEGLADLALDRGGCVRVVRGAVPAAVAAAVKLDQGADANVFPEVDVSRDSGCCCGSTEDKRDEASIDEWGG